MSFPLDSKLDNGATVADWLGTAALAAAMAARRLTDVQKQEPYTVGHSRTVIAEAEQYLTQALGEVREVQAHVARRARPDYDPRVDHPERFMSEDVRQV